MTSAETEAFRANPHAGPAVRLRRYDETAKVKGLQTPTTTHFMTHVAECLNR